MGGWPLNNLMPPEEAAGSNLDDDVPGVLLDENAHLGYLDDVTNISAFADPI